MREAFSPSRLEVEDQSDRHAGHAGAREGGGTHFRVEITSEAFSGQNRVARQRAVMKALESEFADRLHALSISAKAPGE